MPPLDLPNDIWECVLDFLDAKIWLRRLLGISKRFYNLVLPRLYRNLHFVLEPGPHVRLIRLLSSNNRGLAYVRELTLTPRERGHDNENTALGAGVAAAMIATMFVELLPKHILQRFVWDSVIVPPTVLVDLWDRQHNLTNLELISCYDLDVIFLEKPQFLKEFKGLRSIRIMSDMPDCYSQWEAGCLVLRSTCEIDTLILDYWATKSLAQPLQPEGMNKIAGPEDPHFDPEQTLFHPFLPRCGSPLALRRLELNYVDLRWSADTVAPALNFSTLKALKIHCCTRTDLFLSALSQPTSRTPPQLEVLHVKYVEWSHPDPVVDAIDDYLANSQDSLIKLWICLRGSTANPKVSGILRHGSTLKQLFIDVRDTEMPAQDDTERAITYSIEQWRLLARGLVNVVQLAVPFNKIYADGRPLFAHGVPELVFEIELAILLRLPRLETLNITTHPYPNHINTTETTLTAHTQLTTLLANQILALSLSGEHSPRHEPSRLEVIVFGIREGGSRRPTARPTVLHGDDPEHKLTPTYFAKAQHVLQRIFTNEAPKAVMVKVPFRTLKLNNLAVDLMEEVLEETLWDEVSEAV